MATHKSQYTATQIEEARKKIIDNRIVLTINEIEPDENGNLTISTPTVYKKWSDIPTWAQPTCQKLIDRGMMQGNGGGADPNYDVSSDFIRIMVMFDRAYFFDKSFNVLGEFVGTESQVFKDKLNRSELTTHNTSDTAHGDIRKLIDNKVSKENGKGLSSNDFTNEEKIKLLDIPNTYVTKAELQKTLSEMNLGFAYSEEDMGNPYK